MRATVRLAPYEQTLRQDPGVLNRRLYALLRSTLGPIHVTNPGEAAIVGPPFIDIRTGIFKAGFVHRGEHYQVDCPYCNDRKSRLSICHLWCTPDPITGEPMRWLANCYRRGCVGDHHGELVERIFGFKNASLREAIASMRVEPGVVIPVALGPVLLPGEIQPVSDLAGHHPAAAYLFKRGFDLNELVDNWEVSYCRRGEGPNLAAGGRILVPIRFRGDCVGWQARYVGDIDWKARDIPKYLTMKHCPIKRTLYNYDLARKSPVVVVCEGVTDVWAVGREAVALFGKTISQPQVELLGDWIAEGGLVVLMLDPDAWEAEGNKQQFTLEKLTTHLRGRLVTVKLPGDRDPGDYDRPALWRIIRRDCADAGFPLDQFEGAR